MSDPVSNNEKFIVPSKSTAEEVSLSGRSHRRKPGHYLHAYFRGPIPGWLIELTGVLGMFLGLTETFFFGAIVFSTFCMNEWMNNFTNVLKSFSWP